MFHSGIIFGQRGSFTAQWTFVLPTSFVSISLFSKHTKKRVEPVVSRSTRMIYVLGVGDDEVTFGKLHSVTVMYICMCALRAGNFSCRQKWDPVLRVWYQLQQRVCRPQEGNNAHLGEGEGWEILHTKFTGRIPLWVVWFGVSLLYTWPQFLVLSGTKAATFDD